MANTHVSCPTCGARQLKPDARFCHHCGATLPVTPVAGPATPDHAAPPRTLRWFWPALILLVLLALAFGALAVRFQQGVVPDDPEVWIERARAGVQVVAAGAQQAIAQVRDASPPRAGPTTSPVALSPTVQIAQFAPTVAPSLTPWPTATAAPTATPLPTYTPPPTSTPLPTHTPEPTDTPLPSPTPGCSMQVGDRFRTFWQAHRSALGCPLNRAAVTDAATEAFERGRMIWRANNDLIYVLNNAGNWAAFRDTYVEGAPEPGSYAPPAGLRAPVRGFGAIWRERLGGPAARVGWATEPERALRIEAQDFERGAIINLEGTVVLLGEDGERWILP